MAESPTKKAQVVLSAAQYELLEGYARERGKAVSSVVREHLEQTLLPSLEQGRRLAALQHLVSLQAPTADWEEIEQQLERRWEECEPTA